MPIIRFTSLGYRCSGRGYRQRNFEPPEDIECNRGYMGMSKNWKAWLLGTAIAAVSWATTPAHPGTINYIEGQASLGGRALSSSSAGDTSVNEGDVLSTANGRAEMLLTPGVFLRMGHNSAVRMVSPGLTDTRVEMLQGTAMVEATNLRKENHIRILDERASIDLLKNGLYQIDADRDTVAVFDGKATVTQDDRSIDVKSGRELNLNGPLQAEKFDKKGAEKTDDLYQWSKVRSDYIGQANVSIVSSGYAGSGWYWDPWWRTWGFAPVGGVFYSPFWGGFYSPWGYGGYGYGGYYGPTYIYRAPVVVRPGRGSIGGFRGGRSVPAFQGHSAGGFSGRSGGGMGMGRGGGHR
jgi:hypothetical protein